MGTETYEFEMTAEEIAEQENLRMLLEGDADEEVVVGCFGDIDDTDDTDLDDADDADPDDADEGELDYAAEPAPAEEATIEAIRPNSTPVPPVLPPLAPPNVPVPGLSNIVMPDGRRPRIIKPPHVELAQAGYSPELTQFMKEALQTGWMVAVWKMDEPFDKDKPLPSFVLRLERQGYPYDLLLRSLHTLKTMIEEQET